MADEKFQKKFQHEKKVAFYASQNPRAAARVLGSEGCPPPCGGGEGGSGSAGKSATIQVGTVTTGRPGTDAVIENVGTETDAIFNFRIPRGYTGSPGINGRSVKLRKHNGNIEWRLSDEVEPVVDFNSGSIFVPVGINDTITNLKLTNIVKGAVYAQVRTVTIHGVNSDGVEVGNINPSYSTAPSGTTFDFLAGFDPTKGALSIKTSTDILGNMLISTAVEGSVKQFPSSFNVVGVSRIQLSISLLDIDKLELRKVYVEFNIKEIQQEYEWNILVPLSEIQGSQGNSATIQVGTVITGEPGTNAIVTNSGTESEAVFNFTIPRGRDGVGGDGGEVVIPNITATATTLDAGQQATVTKTGDDRNISFNFGIPRGEQGAAGDKGESGIDGKSATIQIGTVTTGESGTQASVTNSGDETNAIFNFTIPKGDRGNNGEQGATGVEGKSAYQSAQEGGFTGSESDFNIALSNINNKITKPESATDGQVLTYRDNSWKAETPSGGGGKGTRYATVVVGTSTSGYTNADVDFLCDGVDDDIEIQKAIDSLSNTGGIVLLLSGVYKISNIISLWSSSYSIVFRGIDNSAVSIEPSKSLDSLIGGNWFNLNTQIIISDIKLNCKISDEIQTEAGITFYGNNITFKNIVIEDAKRYGVHINNNSNNVIIKDSVFKNIESNGIYVQEKSNYHEYFNNYFENINSQSINTAKGLYNSSIHNNVFNTFQWGAIVIWGEHTINNDIANLIISDNLIFNGLQTYSCYGIKVNYLSGTLIKGNNIKKVSDGISIYGYASKRQTINNSVVGNVIDECLNLGISVNCSMSNVIGNTISNCNQNHIACFQNADKCLISSNVCMNGEGNSSDYSGYPILASSGSSNNLFIGNVTFGKNYSDSGTNNTFVENKYQ